MHPELPVTAPGYGKFHPKVKILIQIGLKSAVKMRFTYHFSLGQDCVDKVIKHIFRGSTQFQKRALLGLDGEESLDKNQGVWPIDENQILHMG